jgi:membrane protease YdiL (CAAX protease family)
MDRRAWLWSLGAVLVGSVLGYGLVSQLSGLLIQRGIMPIPASIPDFMDPTSAPDWMAAIDAAVGGLRGNWLLLVALTITLTLNILGEELWWRGVVLPRQELAFGKGTWVIHGVLWGFFHLFKWWDVLNLLPITLALSFVCSRLRNTTPGIVIHSVTNGVALVALFAGVVGLIG